MLKSRLLALIKGQKQRFFLWFRKQEEPNIILLKQFLDYPEVQRLSNAINIPFSVFAAFCVKRNITGFLSESYLNSRNEAAIFFKEWIDENIYLNAIQACYAKNVFNPSEILSVLCFLYVSLARSLEFVPGVFLQPELMSKLIVRPARNSIEIQIETLNKQYKEHPDAEKNEYVRLLNSFFSFYPSFLSRLAPRILNILLPTTLENLMPNFLASLNQVNQDVNHKILQSEIDMLSNLEKARYFDNTNHDILNENKREQCFDEIGETIISRYAGIRKQGGEELLRVSENFTQEQIDNLIALLLPNFSYPGNSRWDFYNIQIMAHLAGRASRARRIEIASLFVNILLHTERSIRRGKESGLYVDCHLVTAALSYIISKSSSELFDYIPTIYGQLVQVGILPSPYTQCSFVATLLTLHHAWVNAYLAEEQIKKLIQDKIMISNVSRIVMEYR